MLTRFAENAIITLLCNAIADHRQDAEVAELADALDSKSSVVTLRAGSSPAFGTTLILSSMHGVGLFLYLKLLIYDIIN